MSTEKEIEKNKSKVQPQTEAVLEGDADSSKSGAGATAAVPIGSLKNFRHHPTIENFYRFVHEYDLRPEVLVKLDEVLAKKREKRLSRKR